jgi:hypothetical protein
MNLVETEVGVTVPDGGTFIDDVYSHYPQLGWRRLVQEFSYQPDQGMEEKGLKYRPKTPVVIRPTNK